MRVQGSDDHSLETLPRTAIFILSTCYPHRLSVLAIVVSGCSCLLYDPPTLRFTTQCFDDSHILVSGWRRARRQSLLLTWYSLLGLVSEIPRATLSRAALFHAPLTMSKTSHKSFSMAEKQAAITRYADQIVYSQRYSDDSYEYRHVRVSLGVRTRPPTLNLEADNSL